MSSPATYTAWATALRQACLLRRKSARPTDGNGCSSWPTARAEDSESRGRRHSRDTDDTLTAASRAWFTPDSSCYKGTQHLADAKAQGHAQRLQDQTRSWATPSSRDWKDTEGMSQTGTNPDGTTRQRVDQLARQVFATPLSPGGPPAQPTPPGGSGCLSGGPNSRPPSMWSTPRPTDENVDRRSDEAKARDHGEQLANQVDMWKTPHGFANTDRHGKTGGGGGEMAKQATTMWATPQANADAGSRNTEGSKAHAGTSLADMVTTGSSRTGRQGNTRRLNVRFVCWFQGFSPDWVDEVPRVDGLRAMGNAVVPMCGAYAIAVLWNELCADAAAREGAA